MYLGRVVEEGTRTSQNHRPRHPYTKALLAAVPDPDHRTRGRGSRWCWRDDPSPLDPPSGCHFRTRCWQAQDRCAAEVPLLEAAPAADEGQGSWPGIWPPVHSPLRTADANG